MTGVANPYAEYKRTQVETSSPEKLVVMLYDGAIKFLIQAKIKMNRKEKDRKQIEEISYSLKRAKAIINELAITLDMKQGGEMAKNLLFLYEFMLNQLVTADIDMDIAPVDRVIGMIKELREAWLEVIKVYNMQKQEKEIPPVDNIHKEKRFYAAV
ncbi:MAG: flagellar export chaperone FliS [Candidatus Eremiobacterota bacterium]